MERLNSRSLFMLVLFVGPTAIGAVLVALQYDAFPLTDVERLTAKGATFVDTPYRGIVGVTLEGPQFNDSDLLKLTRFPDLEAVVLKNSSVTDVGIETLTFHEDLRVLDLSGTAVGRRSIQTLVTLPKLWNLNLTNCPNVGADDLILLAEAPALSMTEFSWRECPEEDFARVSAALGKRFPGNFLAFPDVAPWLRPRLPGVVIDLAEAEQDLRLDEPGWETRLPEIPYRRAFQELYIERSSRPGKTVKPSPHPDSMRIAARLFPEARHVVLLQTREADLPQLASLKKLQRLSLQSSAGLPPAALGRLAELPFLDELSLEGPAALPNDRPGDLTDRTSAFLAAVASLPQVHKLNFDVQRGLQIPPHGFARTPTSACTELWLVLSQTGATRNVPQDRAGEGLAWLPELFPKVTKLVLTNATADDLNHVAQLPQLEEVTLRVDQAPILEALRGHQSLRRLVIQETTARGQDRHPGDVRQFTLADLQSLSTLPRLEFFSSTRELMTDADIGAVAEAIGLPGTATGPEGKGPGQGRYQRSNDHVTWQRDQLSDSQP